MLKIMLLSSINPEQQTGYYNAVNDRVKFLKKEKEIKIWSYSIYKSMSLVRFSIKRNEHHVFIGYPKVFPSHGLFSFLTLCLIRIIIFFLWLNIKPDLIHVHWGYPLAYAATIIKKITKSTKIIVTFHGSDVHTHPNRSKDIFVKTCYLCKTVDHVTAVSERLLLQVRYNFLVPESKSSITYNGVSLDTPFYSENHSCGLTFSFFGNLNETKGADRIIPLYESLSTKIKGEFTFYVGGNGPFYNKIKQYIIKNDISNLKLLGFLPRDEVKKIMRRSNCVFVLSRNEGLGISAIEALVYSQLCIAPEVGGLSEVFSENSMLLVKGEFNALDYVNKFIKCKKNNFKVNRKFILEAFSIENVINKEKNLYNEIMRETE
ncbi:glycosyltransferase [Escherichia albertii]|uniref:glycosyltransferase n=1 Tax=Escherichia albertii TaxID=208962 RepID=UPI0019C568B6|nr:glycosyltransferase [Escherichia albertii]MCI5279469.1 glycosyltransferase [Escherichia albertii]MCZ8663548.1 glycosyltransferase [Escherichia albertii]MCZ8706952.1 glycosyltransferase [Escherichia albertii]MCZ9012987.1 glycosyltransferase [Escherichia albertii]HCZ5334898.1 glycosyltransferase [Escherichia albertii]